MKLWHASTNKKRGSHTRWRAGIQTEFGPPITLRNWRLVTVQPPVPNQLPSTSSGNDTQPELVEGGGGSERLRRLSRSDFCRSEPVCDRRSGVTRPNMAHPLRARNLDIPSLVTNTRAKWEIYRKFGAFWVLLLLLVLSGCGPAVAEAPPSTEAPPTPPTYKGTIVAVGNSLTEGLGVAEAEAYPAVLEQKLQANGYPYRVINAGSSGETSSGALSRVNWVLSLKPDIVILETGGNDGLRAIDPALTEQNIRELVTKFKESGSVVVLAGMQTAQNLGREYTTAYAAIYPTIAEEQDVILIPFFLEGVAAEPTLNQADGIHPTADGYQIVVDTVYPYVVEAIEILDQ